MLSSRSVGRAVAAMAMAGLAVTGCTSSKSRPAGSASPQPTGAASNVPSVAGSGSGSSSSSAPAGSAPAHATSAPPKSAPFPTTGRGAKPVTNQSAVLTSLPGNPKQTCVQVGTHSDLRSGGIGMGNFQTARRSFASQYGKTEVPQLNLYVIPQHTQHLTSASVRVDPPGSAKPTTIRVKDVEEADVYRYFALTLPIRTAGSYMLNVSSGADQGCFIVSFTR